MNETAHLQLVVNHNPDELGEYLARLRAQVDEARTEEEITRTMALGEAALRFARIEKLGHEMQASALKVIVCAQMRLADAVDEGQRSGHVSRAGGDPIVRSSDNGTATLPEIGIDRRRLNEWRKLRDAGREAVLKAIDHQVDQGKAPTKRGIQAALSGFSGNNEWYTPVEWLERARSCMGSIDLDPATSVMAQKNVKATSFYTKDTNGLDKEWKGRIWLNPPYARGEIEEFISKLGDEVACGNVTQAIVLTDNRTDTKWFHQLASFSTAIALTKGRIPFYNESGVGSPANGSTLFYIGNDVDAFARCFGSVCLVLRHV